MRPGKDIRLPILFLLLFLQLHPLQLAAQLYNFKGYSVDDGLSQSQINCIYEDSRGFLWLGTAGGGLNRFDGKEFKVFEEKDGLCGQIINSISEDNNHNLLIGAENGRICRYNGSIFTSVEFSNPKNYLKQAIVFITNDDNGNTIVAKNKQLLLGNTEHMEEITARNDKEGFTHVNCFKKDSRNILWIGTDKGLLVLKNRTLLKISDAGTIDHANITSITEDINGNICVVENQHSLHRIKIIGPSHYQVKEVPFDTLQLPENTLIHSIHYDHNNQLWIASENKGLFKFANNELINFNKSNGLPVDNINIVFEDNAGILWFGTSGGGIAKFTNQAFTYYDNQPGLNEADVFAINTDLSGNTWIGTSTHGVYKFNGKTTENVTQTAKIGDLSVRCIFTDHTNTVWIGTSEHIIQYRNGIFKSYPYSQCQNIRAIFEDSAGNIWIGTRGHGAFCDNGKSLITIGPELGLTNENIYSFAQPNDTTIWMGTGNGIYVFSNGKVVEHIVDGLCNSYAGSLVKDKFNKIWVGTDNCVAVYNGNTFTSFTTKDGLASGTVYLLNTDNFGNVWVGTNKGIDKIVLNEKGEIESIRNYGKYEGFKGVECNSRSTCLDQNGNLWFGTIKGVVKFNPKEELMRKRESPIVHITDIKLFFEKKDLSNYSDSLSPWYMLPINLQLPYDQNHISFDFSAISKSFPDNIRFSFILQGFDKEWSPPLEVNSATYSNLPPGNYKFIVKAINKDGVANDVEQEFSFHISKPFWNTWWFISLCILGLIGFIYGYNEFRKRKHERYLKRLEKIIKERTAEIIKQRDENEVLLKEVHHRVKNNLQIINSLINIQSDYVSDPQASELFREIRNRIRTISLVHEKLYKSEDYGNINVNEYIHMLVENLIDTFSLNKEVNLKLDLEVNHFNLNTIIPLGLLLNELISNSFKYAFNDLENGVISISLKRSHIADQFEMTIADNGKGYDAKIFNAESSTLGLELVKILAEQLNGKIEKLEQTGAAYKLVFRPLKD